MNQILKKYFIGLHGHQKMSGELFERQLTYLFKYFVKSGDFVVDGGASYGRHTRVLSKLVGNEGKVYCFEPIPLMVSKLTDLKLSNAKIFEIGLANVPGRVDFSYIPENSGYSGLAKRVDIPGDYSVESFKICIDLADEVLRNREKKIALMKLDLEGGEFHALLGCRDILIRDRSIVLFENGLWETSKLYGYQEEEFFSYFKSIRYRVIDCFGQETKNFNSSSKYQGWQFIAYPEELNLFAVKFATVYALLQSASSVLFGESLSKFDRRIQSD
jgi:FkbM family methyltransferase